MNEFYLKNHTSDQKDLSMACNWSDTYWTCAYTSRLKFVDKDSDNENKDDEEEEDVNDDSSFLMPCHMATQATWMV